MALAYHAVGWNRQKRIYDAVLAGTLLAALLGYGSAVLLFHPLTTPETFVIRFTAIAALVLLHLILLVGPLSRLDSRYLPLLYNRRHLGVTMFVLAAIHGCFALVQFHAGGDLNPLVSLLTSYRHDYLSAVSGIRNIAHFPFEIAGLAALVILFLMAATSHDFWLKNLGASFWKLMHMLVYAAYGLLLAHVFLGALQSERSPVFPIFLGLGFVLVAGAHLVGYAKERRLDRMRRDSRRDGFERVAEVSALKPDCGIVGIVRGERIALFLREGRVFATSNVCRHQGGPLGEGKIVKGCLTCPWHGYQYRVEDGCSPPPFSEVISTFTVRLIGGEIHVSGSPLPLGTKSEGVLAGSVPESAADGEFYIGWQSKSPTRIAKHSLGIVRVLSFALPVLFFLFGAFQNPVDAGGFEFGVERSFEGTLREDPLALLQVDGKSSQRGMNFLLVGAGKSGPPEYIREKSGLRVRFLGSLIHRNGVAMIEMNKPASFEVVGPGDSVTPPVLALGDGTFVGELVDTKCFFGVMRPATGKVHRACAIRCLSGGAPPGLLVRDDQGNAMVLLLAGTKGKPLDIDIELAARVLEIRGELEIHNGTPVLRVKSWRVQD